MPHSFRPPVFVVTRVLHIDARSVSALGGRRCPLCIASMTLSVVQRGALPLYGCRMLLPLSRCTERLTRRSVGIIEIYRNTPSPEHNAESKQR